MSQNHMCNQLQLDIQEALVCKKFHFVLQPIYNKSGKIEKRELLIRLQIDNKTLLAPGDFFDEAEKNNHFSDILLFALHSAISFLKKNPLEQIAINMSYRDIENKETCLNFLYILNLEDEQITKRIIIEFIESYDIGSIKNVVSFCKELKARQVKISIDDFGIKNSNFYILSILNIDYLKLDGHFIKNIEHEKTYQIVDTIISLCRKLDVKIIAEHIENENDYSVLSAMGVELFQGFYFGKPRS